MSSLEMKEKYMSAFAKWLLILTLGLQLHLIYVSLVSSELGGNTTIIFPFGSVDYTVLGQFVLPELMLALFLWVCFAISLLRGE